MEAYAVVETGGKQYRVRAGDTVTVELLDAEAGKQIEIEPVLALSDGKELKIGTPVIAGAKVTATVLKHFRGPKVVAFYKRRRKGSSRKVGHRQEHTLLKIVSVA